MAFTLVLVHFVVVSSALAVVNVRDSSYSFSYSVNAEDTGDFKSHHESRSGGMVRGSYSVLEPGGVLRVVEYTADPVRGFRAVVHRRPLANTTERLLTSTERLPTTTKRLPAAAEKVPPMEERFLLKTTEELPKKIPTAEELPKKIPTTEVRSYPETADRLPKRKERIPIVIEKIPAGGERFFLRATGTTPQTTPKIPTVERLPTTKGRLPIATEKIPTTEEGLWLMTTERPSRRVTTTTERFSKTTEDEELPNATEKIPTTEERLMQKNTDRLPETIKRLPITEDWSFRKTTERLLKESGRLPIASEKIPMEEATHAPSNLGHFAAVMFSSRRTKKLYRRHRQ